MRIWVRKVWNILFLLVVLTSHTKVMAEDNVASDVISQAIKDDKTRIFQEENKELLLTFQKQQDHIVYSLEAYQEFPYQFEAKAYGETGTFNLMIQFFEQLTQLPFEQYSDIGTKEEMMEKLQVGSIELMLGVTMSERVAKNLRKEHEACNITALQGELFYNPFILVGRVQDEAYTKYTIPHYYWGCLEDQQQEIVGSELDGHTVTYNTLEELEQAFQEEQIQGMLVSQGRENYLATLHKVDYTVIKEALIFSKKYYITSNNSEELNHLMTKMIELYTSLYDEYFEGQMEIAIADDIKQDNAKPDSVEQSKLAILTIVGGTISLLCLMVYSLLRHRQETRIKKLQELIPNKSKSEQDVLWVLISSSKINSKHHFELFGLVSKNMKKAMHLKDLTKKIGFDFQKHYEHVMKKQESEFVCNFELYIRGVAYQFEEVGIYKDNIIVSKLYREENKNMLDKRL